MAIKLIAGELDPAFFHDGPGEPIWVYRKCAEALTFAERRAKVGLDYGPAAKRAGIAGHQVEKLEAGELVPENPADWRVLLQALDSA